MILDPNRHITKEHIPVCIYCVLEAMRMHGGSFVKKLGELWWQADNTNKYKVVTHFANYFEEYAQEVIAKKTRCRHAE